MSVRIRAFRGKRQTSVYREQVLPDESFDAIRDAARGLTLLPSLVPTTAPELDKRLARRLADEATTVRGSAKLPELDAELVALAEVAHWCGRSREHAWLTVDQ